MSNPNCHGPHVDSNLLDFSTRIVRTLNHRHRAAGASTVFCSPVEVAEAAAKVVGCEAVELDASGRVVRVVRVADLRGRLRELAGLQEDDDDE